jgi:hypothetical protein
MKRRYRSALLLLLACATPGLALAHHSYAMFDVPTPNKAGAYDLWGFENGSPSVLQAHGWNKDSIKAGDKVEVEYWRLRDGSIGGHCEKFRLSDGRTLQCPSDLGRRR